MVNAVVRLRKVFGPRVKALQLDASSNEGSSVEIPSESDLGQLSGGESGNIPSDSLL
jgi:hypothetical protein